MKTIGTDGREYILNPSRDSKDIEDENLSDLHKKARVIIQKCMPYYKIYEEVILLGCKGPGGNLIADFLIPSLPMIVEVHGEQHYNYSKFFHKTEAGYKEYLLKDKIKKNWAELNEILYVELPYNQVDKWKSIINGHLS